MEARSEQLDVLVVDADASVGGLLLAVLRRAGLRAAWVGEAGALYMNGMILAKIKSSARRLTIFDQTVDSFGKKIATYNGVPLLNIGKTAAGVEIRRPATVRAFPHDADFRALNPAYLRFTSGTTSERKGVVIGHPAILARLEAANEGLGIGPDDRVLWLLPMAHHFVVSILLYLSRGATLLLPAGALADKIVQGSSPLKRAAAAMNLVPSSTLPPPTARRKSTPSSRQRCAARRQVSY